jgi:hypothetical protein
VHHRGDDDVPPTTLATLNQWVTAPWDWDTVCLGVHVLPDDVVLAADQHAGRSIKLLRLCVLTSGNCQSQFTRGCERNEIGTYPAPGGSLSGLSAHSTSAQRGSSPDLARRMSSTNSWSASSPEAGSVSVPFGCWQTLRQSDPHPHPSNQSQAQHTEDCHNPATVSHSPWRPATTPCASHRSPGPPRSSASRSCGSCAPRGVMTGKAFPQSCDSGRKRVLT